MLSFGGCSLAVVLIVLIAILVVLIALIFLIVLIAILVLVVLVLLILITVLVLHFNLPPYLFAVFRRHSIPRISGFILRLKNKACKQSGRDRRSNSTGGCA